ncbi:Uncharacterised protein [uncultured archaeon]|nr:Uncharacterised protein [uncultured archaeon]
MILEIYEPKEKTNEPSPFNPYSQKNPIYVLKNDDGTVEEIIGTEEDAFAMRNFARLLKPKKFASIKNIQDAIQEVNKAMGLETKVMEEEK